MPLMDTRAWMSRSRSRVVNSTVSTTSVTRRAATTASTGSCPAEALMNRLAENRNAARACGLSSSGAVGAMIGSFGRRGSSCRPNSQFITTLRAALRSGAGVQFAAPNPLQIRLGALDLALQRGHRLRHAVHRLGPEGVDRIHRLEHVVERQLQLLHRDAGAGRLL